jgi:hypothetical protein
MGSCHTVGMPKRISRKKRKTRISQEPDPDELMHRRVMESVAEFAPESTTGAFTKTQISQLMSQMGRKGGKIGGKRRMQTMTQQERSQVALKAAQARWKNRKKATQP